MLVKLTKTRILLYMCVREWSKKIVDSCSMFPISQASSLEVSPLERRCEKKVADPPGEEEKESV